MNYEHEHLHADPHHLPAVSKEQLSSLEERNIEQAAQALAQGELVIMQLYTPGLLVNGADEQALQKLFAAKQIDYAKAVRGERPIVSILPAKEHRQGLIAVHKHHPEVQPVLAEEDRHLLTEKGHSLFYRVHIDSQLPYLRHPLISEDEQGNRSMVFLWHDNLYLRLLEERVRAYKGADQPVLLSGSSANSTGHTQPRHLRELDPTVLSTAATTVDLQDENIFTVPHEQRGAIPMINLLDHPPTIMRGSRMYEPVPAHPHLRKLVGQQQSSHPA